MLVDRVGRFLCFALGIPLALVLVLVALFAIVTMESHLVLALAIVAHGLIVADAIGRHGRRR